MADSSERNNPPHFEEEEQQREITNNQPQAEPDDDDDEDYVDDDADEEDEEEVEEEEEEDSYSEEEEEVEEEEEEDSYSEEEEEAEDEEEYMDPAVMSSRVSVNSVEVVGEPNGCGQGGKVAAVAGEGGEVDGLTCPICMGPWTSTGDHQVCCLSCGHLYGLSCIRRWLEHRKGSAKCPQCNQKCKPKDVRVIYASRVVVADEESKEKIHHLEAKMALLIHHLEAKMALLEKRQTVTDDRVRAEIETAQAWRDQQDSRWNQLFSRLPPTGYTWPQYPPQQQFPGGTSSQGDQWPQQQFPGGSSSQWGYLPP